MDPRDNLVEHLPALRAFSRGLTRDATLADDMVQETLVKAWAAIASFDPTTNMRAWLFTILRNTYYSNRRKAGREVADVDGIMAANLYVAPAHDGRLHFADFRRAFETLPLEQREALMLVGAMGVSVAEAAETCGVAPGTIKSRAARARARLADLLDLGPDGVREIPLASAGAGPAIGLRRTSS
jgi:RNA polymerase sigma-70 factor (ECF subfamily)